MRNRPHVLHAVFFLLLAAPVLLQAQRSDDRQALTRLRDSLTATTDTVGLQTLETNTIDLAKRSRDDALIHLRLGLIALRLRELGSKRHLDYAISEFEWAGELQPDWPWPQYGLGLIEKLSPGAGRYGGGLFTMLGLDADSKAGKAFTQSVQRDSSFSEGLLGLSEVALTQRINAPIDGALNAMRAATAHSTDPQLFLARGRLERVAGHPDSALRSLSVAKTLGGPADMLWLEMARTIPLVPTSIREWLSLPPEDSVYAMGAASEDSAVVAMYRMDIAPIAEDTALAHFDSLHGSDRVRWLQEFWHTRDQLDLRPSGSRMAEHFKRWDQARREFPLTPYRRRYARGLETYKSGNRDVDDRGIVLLRHGIPTERIVWPNSPRGPADTVARHAQTDFQDSTIKLGQYFLNKPAVAGNYGNESWVYRRPDGDMVLHFAANFDLQDYRLQTNVLALDVAFFDILQAINSGTYLPGVRRILTASGAEIDQLLTEERIRGKRDNAKATTTDSWFREYPMALPGREGWYVAGVRNQMPLAHLIYAVDAKAISAQPWNMVPITLRAVFLDSLGRVVATLDTTEMVTQPKRGTTVVAVRAEVPLPPGAQRARVGVEITPDRGVVHRTDTLRIPSVDGSRLSLSDLLVGRRENSIQWAATPSDTAWLDPQMSYHASDVLQVYAEAYGVLPDESYTMRLVLTKEPSGMGRLFGKRTETVTLTETRRFAGTTGRISRALELSKVGPGDYTLEVSIEGKNGRTSQQRRVYIIK